MQSLREIETPGEPPEALVAHWVSAGVLDPGSYWVALSGGRTNAVWRVDPPDGGPAKVCKLFRAEGETPLFDNDPASERLALEALAGTSLAPGLVAAGATAAGQSLVYAHVAGRGWTAQDDPAPVARALARLHACTAPVGLPKKPMGPEFLREQTLAMLAGLGAGGADLGGLEPAIPALPTVQAVFLHGDATAGNALVVDSDITFIDWQCPARGDAAEDLAVFLSPAMQMVSGNAQLSVAQEEAFLAAYGDASTVARYRTLRPLFHWRMAAYARWRAARGDTGYAAAAEAEIAALRSAS